MVDISERPEPTAATLGPAIDAAGVKAAVDAALQLLRRHVAEIEDGRRLPDVVVSTLQAAGIHRLAMPTALGGLQADVLAMLDVVERLATVDGSAAWCSVIGIGSNVFAGYLAEPVARQVFADPDRGNATMFAPLGRLVADGGQQRLTGRWPFTSNCLHSAWIGVGALMADSAGAVLDPVPRVAFVEASSFTIEDTWDAVGLRGTGSHHVAADGVAVSPDHCCRFSDRPWPEGTLWRMPLYTVLLPLLATVPLGLARGALDELGRQAREGRAARRGQLGDDPISMAELAVADGQLRGARAALREAVEEGQRLAAHGSSADRSLQAATMLACLQACDVGVEVTSVAHRLGGGAAAYAGSPLLRALCDAQAARQHLLFSHQHRSALGRVLVGLDEPYLPYIN